MRIKITKSYTDKETKEYINAGQEITVKYERGMALIKNGNARLISYDDDVSINTAELEKALVEKDSIITGMRNRIAELEFVGAEQDNRIAELEKALISLQKPKKQLRGDSNA